MQEKLENIIGIYKSAGKLENFLFSLKSKVNWTDLNTYPKFFSPSSLVSAKL